MIYERSGRARHESGCHRWPLLFRRLHRQSAGGLTRRPRPLDDPNLHNRLTGALPSRTPAVLVSMRRSALREPAVHCAGEVPLLGSRRQCEPIVIAPSPVPPATSAAAHHWAPRRAAAIRPTRKRARCGVRLRLRPASGAERAVRQEGRLRNGRRFPTVGASGPPKSPGKPIRLRHQAHGPTPRGGRNVTSGCVGSGDPR
jgi:hypothetical protein